MWQLDLCINNNTSQSSTGVTHISIFNAYTVRVTANQIAGRGRTMSYADDVLVFRQRRYGEQIAGELQAELDHSSTWSIEAEALVNQTKEAVT
jgi:hypothetical protein